MVGLDSRTNDKVNVVWCTDQSSTRIMLLMVTALSAGTASSGISYDDPVSHDAERRVVDYRHRIEEYLGGVALSELRIVHTNRGTESAVVDYSAASGRVLLKSVVCRQSSRSCSVERPGQPCLR